MKNKMPIDGLGLGHDSGSVHCDMLKMLCFRTAWGGGIARSVTRIIIDRYRASQRCFRALLGGFIVYIRPHNCDNH